MSRDADFIQAVQQSKLADPDKFKLIDLFKLIATPAEEMTPAQLRQAREAAVEGGFPTPDGPKPWLVALLGRMNHVYGLGPSQETRKPKDK